ncbi:MAG: hypothetical protein RLZZ113_1709 [Pseudomonadota bacterium]
MHGYTCSGHPLACAAALAMLDVLEEERLIDRVRELAPRFESLVHGLADTAGVISIRNLGLAAGIELAADPGGAGIRGAKAQSAAFDRGILTRAPGDTLIFAPPFISSVQDVEEMVDRLRLAIEDTA